LAKRTWLLSIVTTKNTCCIATDIFCRISLSPVLNKKSTSLLRMRLARQHFP
jgi:hypothetical protein